MSFLGIGNCLGSIFAGPSASFSVTITGTGEVGETLTVADFGTFDSVQWTRNGTPIGAATGATYVLQAADDLTTVRCEGTIGAETVPSNGIAVTYAAPAVDAAATTSGSASEGGNLTGTPATFTGGGVTIANEWQVSDDDSVWTDTGDTDTTSPTLVAAKYYRFKSVGTSSGGSATSFSTSVGPVAASVNPVVTDDTYTAGSAGNPATFNVTGSYAGADDLTLYGVFGTSTITVTEAQLIAGSGGTNTLEFFSVSAFDFDAGSFDITGLTATSESANQLKYVIVEDTNGGTTGVLTAGDTISGLDFTPATFVSANVDTEGDLLTIVFSSAVYGTSTPSAFTLGGVSAGTPTLGTVSGLGTTTLTMPISVNLPVSGDTLTIGYNAATGDLVDASGNETATYTAQTVTNNVPAAGFADNFNRANQSLTSSANWQVYADINTANSTFEIVSNELVLSTTDPNPGSGACVRTSTLMSGDTFAEIEYRGTVVPNFRAMGPVLWDDANSAGYESEYSPNTFRFSLRRRNGAVVTQLGNSGVLSPAPVVGDVLRIERIITSPTVVQARLLVNGVQVHFWNDNAADRVTGDVYGGICSYIGQSGAQMLGDNFNSGLI